MLDFNNSLNLEESNSFKFKSFGVRIEIKATHKRHLKEVLRRITKALPNNIEFIADESVEHLFEIKYLDNGILSFINNKDESSNISEVVLFNYLESKIRLTVAENAVSKVFLHAGVVAFGNKAIIMPASSYAGKTTLVKEFLKKGATYFSDEYAVLDKNGFVHPFPKTLSVRGIIGDRQQVEIPAENFGGTISFKPCNVGMILITEFQVDSKWNPVVLSKGEGIMEIIPHTLPIRINTKFTMQVLNKVATRAIICKSLRGEASAFAEKILEFFELNT